MRYSLVILGGGLSGTLLALELRDRGFDNFLLIEGGDSLGGNRTWSCFSSDLNSPQRYQYMQKSRWESHTVQFPKFNRALATPYMSFASDKLADFAAKSLSTKQYRLRTLVTGVWQNEVTLSTGESLWGDLIVDTRSLPLSEWSPCGWQKFVGWEIEFTRPHGLHRPVLMDANLEQKDGYRFMYLLPFSDRVLLCEDTRYSDDAQINIMEFRGEIRRYLERRFQGAYSILREEQGQLPIPLSRGFSQKPLRVGSVLNFGVRGGFFHPVTSYSFPWATKLTREFALAIASQALNLNDLESYLLAQRKMMAQNGMFYEALNRMLFMAARPEERYKIFQRFYTLPEGLIQRFYSGRTTLADASRIIVGKPPVNVIDAFRALMARPNPGEERRL